MQHPKATPRLRFSITIVLALLALMLSGCQSTGMKEWYKTKFSGTAKWAVLPLVSSVTVEEDVPLQLERMLVVQLPSAGIQHPQLYPQAMANEFATGTLSDANRRKSGTEWALAHHVNFVITGDIVDWQVEKNGQFRVVVELKASDMKTGESIWQASGQGEGKVEQDAYEVSRTLLANLLTTLPVNKLD